mmetsp:Transcript_93203/g.234208  ORF Transcript_93203/g.234208 Transcript_93203/m.234208 type:complete len:203 (+) Transcript_93203:193-801(+)
MQQVDKLLADGEVGPKRGRAPVRVRARGAGHVDDVVVGGGGLVVQDDQRARRPGTCDVFRELPIRQDLRVCVLRPHGRDRAQHPAGSPDPPQRARVAEDLVLRRIAVEQGLLAPVRRARLHHTAGDHRRLVHLRDGGAQQPRAACEHVLTLQGIVGSFEAIQVDLLQGRVEDVFVKLAALPVQPLLDAVVQCRRAIPSEHPR